MRRQRSGQTDRNRAAAVVALAALLLGCTSQPIPTPSVDDDLPRGGTLRLGTPADDPPPSGFASSDPTVNVNALDPHIGGWYDANEIHRCCLTRTLMSYEGRRTSEGGTVLRPDLAAALPEVSADGLSWTFRIRDGVHYAPPLHDSLVTAGDFVRGLTRALRFQIAAGYSALVQLSIRGVDDYLAGVTDTVSGLETPDDHTLRVHLERPAGDLPSRFALPDTAPIPPSPLDPAAPFGVATGHDADYGRFLATTGPYMIEGSDLMDFSVPPAEQRPAAGYVPGASLVLVRNPAWLAESDPLRPAYVERIEFGVGGTLTELSSRVDRGELDFVYSAGSPPQAPLEQVARFDGDPSLGQVHRDTRDITRLLWFNLALPPFDDLHVRRAVNLVIDKSRLIAEGEGVAAGHIVLDSVEQDLLKGHAPLGRPDGGGDMEAAMEEMRSSRYDTDGDGVCDAAACSDVSMLTFFRLREEQAQALVEDLARIGIAVVPKLDDPGQPLTDWLDPVERNGMYAGGVWAKDTLDAASFFRTVFHSRWSMSDDVTNGNMVGASIDRLASWGYDVAEAPPGVDERIDACSALADATSQVGCWSDLDLYMMEMVVPLVPLYNESYIRTTGPRVVAYAFDQLVAMPALDRIALTP